MIDVRDADILLRKALRVQAMIETKTLLNAVGCILAEDVIADRPQPPFDRVAMDGIAIAFADWADGIRTFQNQGVQAAGQAALTLGKSGACIEVMTGAVRPVGTDTVIPYEALNARNSSSMQVGDGRVVKGQHLFAAGTDAAAGTILIREGTLLLAPHLGIAAAVGKSTLRVRTTPHIAIITTGDELVAVDSIPLDHQIRRSNDAAIAAGLLSRDLSDISMYAVSDSREALQAAIAPILAAHDVLILTGGVSKGAYDLVPDVLAALDVTCVLHGVRQRPGKPLWVGVGPEGQSVFALPGNPVSALVCLYRYVLPLLKPTRPARAHLTNKVPPSAFTQFIPVRLCDTKGIERMVEAVPTQSSGDFVTLGLSDGFIELDPNSEGGDGNYYSWN